MQKTLFLENNYSRFHQTRLNDNTGHICYNNIGPFRVGNGELFQNDWDLAGSTSFFKVRLMITDGGVTINRTDLTYAIEDPTDQRLKEKTFWTQFLLS